MALTGRDVGACLRDARERKGLTLRQIAAATRISVSALDAIERNDISKLPGGIFSRAFVRGYAREVGLDAEETVRDFVEQFPVEAVTSGSPLVETPAHDVDRTLDPDLKPWPRLVAIGAVVVIGIVGLALAVLWVRGALTASASSESPVAPAAPPTAGLSEPVPTSVTPPAPAASAAPAPVSPAVPAEGLRRSVPVDGLRITVATETLCWVRVVADGVVRYEGLLEKGMSQTREARRSLIITVGDAAACQVTINDRRAKPLGGSGRVVTLRVTPETLEHALVPQ